MKKKRIAETFSLNTETADVIVRKTTDFLKENNTDAIIITKVNSVMEDILEILLDGWKEKDKVPLRLVVSRKFQEIVITIEYIGKRFNPIAQEQTDEFSEIMLKSLDMRPVWSYFLGINRIAISVPYIKKHSEISCAGAVAAAIIFGLFGGIIPEEVRTFLITYVLTPASDVFLKLLGIAAPMLIFLSVIVSITQNANASSLKLRKYIVKRYFFVSSVLTAISVIGLLPFFRFTIGAGSGTLGSVGDTLFQMLLDIIPGNLIQPFVNSNTLQIIFLAVILGSVIMTMENLGDRVRTTLDDAYNIFMKVIEYVCVAVPVFVFASLTKILWENGTTIITDLWKPILAIIAIYLLLILLYVLCVAVRYKASPLVLIKKIMPPTLIGLTTASSMAAYGKINEANHQLGIEKECSDFSIPIGSQLFFGAASAVFLVIAYYLAEYYQTEVNVDWFIVAGIITMVVSLATPPVSGGTLICLNILMAALGIPEDGLAVASTLALLFDFVSTGSFIAMRHMEMVLQAGHLDMLNVNTLRAPDVDESE